MRKFKFLFGFLFMLLTMSGAALSAMAADTINLPITVTEDYDMAKEMLILINNRRHELGVMNDLQIDATLQDISMQRAAELVVSFDHYRPDGTQVGTEICGENIGSGAGIAELMFEKWKNSTMHVGTMVAERSNFCGIGCVVYEGTRYWVLNTSAEAMGPLSTRSGKADVKRTLTVDKSKIQFKVYDWIMEGYGSSVNTIGMYYGKPASAGVVIQNFYPDEDAGIGYRCDPSLLTFSGGTPGVATVSQSGVVNALSTGSSSLTVALKDDPRVSATVPFDIVSNVLNGDLVIKALKNTYPYTGKPVTLELKVNDCFGNLLTEGRDYCIEYKDNINPGLTNAYVRMMGNYDSPFLAGANFYIVNFRIEENARGGSTQKQPKKEETSSQAGGNSTNGGASKSRDNAVSSSGSSTGSREDADLKPEGTSISSLKVKAKGKLSVKWKKKKGISGYQIQYALNKKLTKDRKTKKVTGSKKTSVTLTKLKRGKTYYVRIRTYRIVKGRTYYSNWSKAKKKK